MPNFSTFGIRFIKTTAGTVRSLWAVLLAVICLSATSSSAADCGAYRTPDGLDLSARIYVQYLLRNDRVVYWYTRAGDADWHDLDADGTLDTATLVETRRLGAPARDMLRARGIMPVASVDLPADADEDTLYQLMTSPLDQGWDAVALDEFLPDTNMQPAVRALERVRRWYPDAAIIAWVQPEADVARIAPLADLLIVEITDPRTGSAHLRESHARTLPARLDAVAATLRAAGDNARAVPAKSVLAVCVADAFDDAAPDPDAYLCDNRQDVDFYRFLDDVLLRIRKHPEMAHGAAFFGRHRARPATVRFVNTLAAHYFRNKKAAPALAGGSWHDSVAQGGFEKDGAWAFAGGGAAIVTYESTGLPANVRAGHAWSFLPEFHAEAPHGSRALRMQGDGRGCSTASQELRLEPGATYEFTALLTGARGGERASVWVHDAANGKDHFQAVLPVQGIPEGRWLPVRFTFTLPGDTDRVALVLSDCDLNAPQTIFWDQVQANKILDPAEMPRITAAAPMLVSGEGYGFRMQWTPLLHRNTSFAQVQFSLDGVRWDNIATLFDEAQFFDWLPQGMATLPFKAVPPGQEALFRVKIVFWDDSETPWSPVYRVTMPRYESERTPLLLFAADEQILSPCGNPAKGLRLALLPPEVPPPGYTVQTSADLGETWTDGERITDVSAQSVTLKKTPPGSGLLRLRADFPGEPVFSNIIVPRMRDQAAAQ